MSVKKRQMRIYRPIEIQKISYQKIAPLMRLCIDEMTEAAQKIQATLPNFPSGRLRISPHRESYQYYHIKSVKGRPDRNRESSKGTYIPNDEIELARSLAQKAYNEKVCESFFRGAEALRDALTKFNYQEIENCFDALSPSRQALTIPAYLSNEKYAERWQKEAYQGKSFSDDEIMLTTAKGERVRSKSEVIIANTLNQMGIPYRYEFPLKLSSGRLIYPDFTCLNVRTRDEFIWEHFGRMNDADYQGKAFKKLDSFAAEGYIHGVNLIFTMESDVRPINPKMIELMAKKFLL